MNKPTIIFLINPKSGHKNNINKELLVSNFKDYQVITYFKKDGRGDFIRQKLKEGHSNFVVGGGDGTVNEVASVLMNTNARLGIIPLGSGNGLARSLNIPMDISKAFEVIKNGGVFKIDAGFFNEKPFFCTAGLGFDALCAFDYAHKPHTRGFWNYFKIILQNYFSFKSVSLTIDNKPEEGFVVTFANAPQYGNNAYISPLSKLNDGIIECNIIKPHSRFLGPLIGFRIMNKKVHLSKYYKGLQGKEFNLNDISMTIAHIDGEPITLDTEKIKIKLKKEALSVIVP